MVTTCAARSRGSSSILETRSTACFIVTGSTKTLSIFARSIACPLFDECAYPALREGCGHELQLDCRRRVSAHNWSQSPRLAHGSMIRGENRAKTPWEMTVYLPWAPNYLLVWGRNTHAEGRVFLPSIVRCDRWPLIGSKIGSTMQAMS